MWSMEEEIYEESQTCGEEVVEQKKDGRKRKDDVGI